jgi:DNA-binding winged helix-turn-helix (wHTH) protein/TolB-like protein/Tfp pilus assembly protein PilF
MYLKFGEFVVAVRQRRLLRLPSGEAIPLTAKVFDTLLYFAEHAGEVLDKDTLLAAIWPGVVVEENSLTQNVSTLRQVLGEARGENRYIVTVPRKGYRFVAEVEPLSAMPPVPVAAAQPLPVGPPPAAQPTRERARSGWTAAIVIGAAVLALVAAALFFRTADPPRPSDGSRVAVLPFKPLVAADRDESLELGMTESLIAALSAQEKLEILPLSSVRRFGAPDQDPLAAGRSLGVPIVLDGSLQRRDDRIRVSARLLRVSDGRQLWADTFDEKLQTIFEMQDAIAERVSEALLARLAGATPAVSRSPARGQTEDSEAYLLYANGRLAWTRATEASLTQAIGYFEEAIARDPQYALAHAGLADCYAILGVFGMRAPHETYPRARRAAEKALEIDDSLAPVHATLGHIRIQYDFDWRGGLAEYARAVELDPSYAGTYHYRGIVLAMHGEIERSLEEFRRAQQLEPLWIAPRAAMGMILGYAKRYDESIRQLTQTLALDERADNARTYLGRAYLHSGHPDLALAEFQKRRSPAPGSYGDVAQALVLSGRREEARAELDRLLQLSRERYVAALDIATIHASLGEKDKAFEWLARAFEERSTNLGFIAQDPSFEAMRDDPRFEALIERIGVWKRPLGPDAGMR